MAALSPQEKLPTTLKQRSRSMTTLKKPSFTLRSLATTPSFSEFHGFASTTCQFDFRPIPLPLTLHTVSVRAIQGPNQSRFRDSILYPNNRPPPSADFATRGVGFPGVAAKRES